MKEYESHKVVQAAKVVDAMPIPTSDVFPRQGFRLRIGDGPLDFVDVELEWMRLHAPTGDWPRTVVGGYFVSYLNGYTSWSPADAFEEGYAEVVHDPKDGALPVAGYKAQTPETVRTVNLNKQAEEATLQILDALESYPGIDRRWLSIGRTHIEQGWMAVNRAVFKPGRVKLPGDDPSGPHPTANPPGSPDAWRG